MSSVLFRSQFVLQPLVSAALVIGSGVILISPASAATLASSESAVIFSNFSHVASTTATDSKTNTLSIEGSDDASVVATGTTDATFLATGPGFNITSSLAFGSGGIYSGTSRSIASLLGVFETNGLFSFDFNSTMQLQAEIDDSRLEMAEALGSIGIQIEDITAPDSPILLDELVFGGRVSPGSQISFFSDASSGFELEYDCAPAPSCLQMGSKRRSSFISAQFLGSYSHSFSHATTLRLSEIKINRATVQATAEPNTVSTPSLLTGIIGFVSTLVRRRKEQALAV